MIAIKKQIPKMQPSVDIRIINPQTGGLANIRCIALLRQLMGKRCTYEGLWEDRPVIVKLFTSPLRGFLHFRREQRGLSLLTEAGIPTPRLLHSGKTPDGKWALIFEKITPAEDLAQRLEKTHSESQTLELCQQWLDLLARMHQKRILQTDLQPGNFLFNGSTLYALDPGTVRKSRFPISVRAGLRQLAGMLSTMPPSLRENPQPWLEGYCRHRGWQPTEKMQTLLKKFLRRQRQHIVRRSLKKTLRDSKRYFSLHEGPYRGMFTRRDWTEETARQFVRQIDHLMESGQILKRGNTCFVSRVQFGSLDIAVKRYNYKGFWHSLRHTLKGSRARKCWLAAHRLQEEAIPCARPLAFVKEKKNVLDQKTYYLTVYINGTTLDHFLKSPTFNTEQKNTILKKTKGILHLLCEFSFFHADPKPSNFLIGGEQVILIDLDSIHYFPFPIFFFKKFCQRKIAVFQTEIQKLSNPASNPKQE
jgi:tRNA A-37 threonylcarbamoyl transferase component Bud32